MLTKILLRLQEGPIRLETDIAFIDLENLNYPD